MRPVPECLAEIRTHISAHARADLGTPIDGLHLSKVMGAAGPDYSLTTPLLVVMAQGGKRLLLGEQVFEYRAGDLLMVTANLPVTGDYLDTGPESPSLAMGLELRPAAISALMLRMPPVRNTTTGPAMATGPAGSELLDAAARLLRLLDQPADVAVLAPLIEQEILWRLLTGPHAAMVRQIGSADSDLAQVSIAVTWMRDNYAEPVRIGSLARMCGMSESAFHRQFRAVTAMSPLQFQKRIRLQQARSMLVVSRSDIAGIGHRVGYDSPSQFTREYRRLFGVPPGQDAAQRQASFP